MQAALSTRLAAPAAGPRSYGSSDARPAACRCLGQAPRRPAAARSSRSLIVTASRQQAEFRGSQQPTSLVRSASSELVSRPGGARFHRPDALPEGCVCLAVVSKGAGQAAAVAAVCLDWQVHLSLAAPARVTNVTLRAAPLRAGCARALPGPLPAHLLPWCGHGRAAGGRPRGAAGGAALTRRPGKQQQYLPAWWATCLAAPRRVRRFVNLHNVTVAAAPAAWPPQVLSGTFPGTSHFAPLLFADHVTAL